MWPGADKTINRSNPPPAYSPESHWPGPPCITRQRDGDTMRQKVRDREADTEKDWQMEGYREKLERRMRVSDTDSFPSCHSFLHQQASPVRRPIAVKGQSGVSGPTLMLMKPTRSQQCEDVNTMRRAVMEKMIQVRINMALLMPHFWW